MCDFTQCPFCKSAIAPHWRTVNVWKCSSCKLLFRNPAPSSEGLTELYKESWLDPCGNIDETGGTDLNFAKIYTKKLAASLNLKNISGLKILDFGAGRGSMLTALTEAGADVYGIEPFGYDSLRQKGFKIFRTLDEVPKEFTFDGIVTIDVIEHLQKPWYVIADLRRLLRAGGWLCVTTPNVQGLNALLFRGRWREALRPGHLYFFSQKTLDQMFKEAGYTEFERMRWFVRYSRNPLRALLNAMLQLTGLDGELRYICYNP